MKADHMTDSELDGLCEALTHQRQIDEDGTEVGVSRQAVDMAIAAIKELRERVARVEAERDALQKKMGENFCGYIENIAALKKDAERYRWLRGFLRHAKWADHLESLRPEESKYITDETLDSAIDAARSKP